MASNPMQQFTVHRIGPEIKIAGIDLSFPNASLFMVISASIILLFLFLGTKEKKMTVIANLHTLDTAKHYCDRIIGMSLGEVVFDDVPSKLTDQLAKEIYGAEADEAFEASLTSTSLGTTQKAEAS